VFTGGWSIYAVITGSPAGLAVLMVTKHETSTLRQSLQFYIIDLKFGVGDYITRFSNPAKFGEVRISGGAPTWW